MTAGYARCRVCGTSFPMTVDIPLDQHGVCDGCRAESNDEDEEERP